MSHHALKHLVQGIKHAANTAVTIYKDPQTQKIITGIKNANTIRKILSKL